MPDAFETLLALGSGVTKRKRENELLELKRKENEQTRQQDRKSELMNALVKFAPFVDFPSFQSAISQVDSLVSQSRGNEAFGLLKQKQPIINTDPSKREKFNQDISEFDTTQKRLSDKFTVTEKRLAGQFATTEKRLKNKSTIKNPKLEKQKQVLTQLNTIIDDTRARLTQIITELKSFDFKDSPERKNALNKEQLRIENKLKGLEFRRDKKVKRLNLNEEDSLGIMIEQGLISQDEASKLFSTSLDRFDRKLNAQIKNGSITKKDAVFSFRDGLKIKVDNGTLGSEEAIRLTIKFKDSIFGTQ